METKKEKATTSHLGPGGGGWGKIGRGKEDAKVFFVHLGSVFEDIAK